MANTGFSTGDVASFLGNPLSTDLLKTHIPQLQARGVRVIYDVKLTLVVNGIGSTIPAVGSYTYRGDTVIDVLAAPASGWQFVNWTGDVANPNSASTNVTMNDNKIVTANFTPVVFYTLTMAVSGNGTTDPAIGSYTHGAGTTVNISATAASGWQFDRWNGADNNTANPTTVTMTSDMTVTANFMAATLPILTTYSATNITSSSARLNGTYDTKPPY